MHRSPPIGYNAWHWGPPRPIIKEDCHVAGCTESSANLLLAHLEVRITTLVLLLVTALSVITVRPLAVVKAEMPAGEQSELRAKLPITNDTPNDRIVARIGTEVIKVGDFKAFTQEAIEVHSEQLDQAYADFARPILKHLVEMKLVLNDAIHIITDEDIKKIHALLDAQIRGKGIARFDEEVQSQHTGRTGTEPRKT